MNGQRAGGLRAVVAARRAEVNGADGHALSEPQKPSAVGSVDTRNLVKSISSVDELNSLLLHQAEFLTGIEKTRTATENRLRALLRKGRKFNTEVVLLKADIEHIRAMEDRAVKNLTLTMRRHPLAGWMDMHRGLGPQQVGRLFAAVGDPLLRPDPHDMDGDMIPRTLSQFRQYCGHGDPERSKRRKDNVRYVEVEGEERPVLPFNPKAKTRVRVIADKVVQTNKCAPCKAETAKIEGGVGWPVPPDDCYCAELNPWKGDYNEARVNWLDRDVSKGHAESHGLRLVGKAMLKSLFEYAESQAMHKPTKKRRA